MGLFDRMKERKQARAIRRKRKTLRDALLAAGHPKKTVDDFLEKFFLYQERAASEQAAYKSAYSHIKTCSQQLEELLGQMATLSEGACKEKLMSFLQELSLVYHDCLIRRDDIDFASTFAYLKDRIPVYTQADRLLLQSELENLKALLEDVLLWEAPDFLALVYFLQYGNAECLSDMENTQRNRYIEQFYQEQFRDKNAQMLAEMQQICTNCGTEGKCEMQR